MEARTDAIISILNFVKIYERYRILTDLLQVSFTWCLFHQKQPAVDRRDSVLNILNFSPASCPIILGVVEHSGILSSTMGTPSLPKSPLHERLLCGSCSGAHQWSTAPLQSQSTPSIASKFFTKTLLGGSAVVPEWSRFCNLRSCAGVSVGLSLQAPQGLGAVLTSSCLVAGIRGLDGKQALWSAAA